MAENPFVILWVTRRRFRSSVRRPSRSPGAASRSGFLAEFPGSRLAPPSVSREPFWISGTISMSAKEGT